MKKGIIFTGAQGTGKTTILEALPKINNRYLKGTHFPVEFITEIVRRLNKTQQVQINEGGNEDGQKMIFDKYVDEFDVSLKCSWKRGFVSDRGLTDVFAYTTWLHRHGKISDEFYEKQKQQLIDWIKEWKDDVTFCYFPIEFPLVKDGVRSTNEDFRNEIDLIIKEILTNYVKDFVVIEGTVEDRMHIIQTLY